MKLKTHDMRPALGFGFPQTLPATSPPLGVPLFPLGHRTCRRASATSMESSSCWTSSWLLERARRQRWFFGWGGFPGLLLEFGASPERRCSRKWVGFPDVSRRAKASGHVSQIRHIWPLRLWLVHSLPTLCDSAPGLDGMAPSVKVRRPKLTRQTNSELQHQCRPILLHLPHPVATLLTSLNEKIWAPNGC